MAQLPARGEIVRALRAAHRLRAVDLADAAGITKHQLSHIEAGRKGGGAGIHAPALAAALGVDVEVLTGQKPVIAALREAEAIPADTLARDVGVDPDRLARLEVGAELPDEQLATVLAVRLGVPVPVVRPTLRGAA